MCVCVCACACVYERDVCACDVNSYVIRNLITLQKEECFFVLQTKSTNKTLSLGTHNAATQQPTSCCCVVLWRRPNGFIWGLLLRLLTALGAEEARQCQLNAATQQLPSLVAASLGVCSQPHVPNGATPQCSPCASASLCTLKNALCCNITCSLESRRELASAFV